MMKKMIMKIKIRKKIISFIDIEDDKKKEENIKKIIKYY